MLQLCIWKLQQKCQLGWSIIHTEQVHYGPNNHRFIPFHRITHLIIDMIVRTPPNNQIRTIAGCACAGNVSQPPTSKETASWRSRHASRHVPWCVSASLTRSCGENVPGIAGACATRNFTHMLRGPWDSYQVFIILYLSILLTTHIFTILHKPNDEMGK